MHTTGYTPRLTSKGTVVGIWKFFGISVTVIWLVAFIAVSLMNAQ
jgi:hypothetical protein